ncbi:MAG: hypothetical protein A49_06490 [Methyloceanibacter sp.]|nr:MAG: hypothetical protein A49_06490 [Methyloceanibacter sp.]
MGDIDRPADPAMHDTAAATVRIARRIAEVPAAQWDACARGESGSGRPPNPFVSHAFLSALEDSGSATRDTGWLPQHLLFEDAQGRLLACMPCYLKGHSQGEYVFDHGWAEAYMRAGGDYYPKLQAAVPFSPVPGPRLLVRGETARIERQALLLEAGRTLTNELDVSSLHITFMSQDEWKLAGELGYLQRTDRQFHWHNAGYETFDDFLRALARASARRSGASGARHWTRASRSNGSRGATSPKPIGTRSSPSTWIRARANGAGPISRARPSAGSARACPANFSW